MNTNISDASRKDSIFHSSELRNIEKDTGKRILPSLKNWYVWSDQIFPIHLILLVFFLLVQHSKICVLGNCSLSGKPAPPVTPCELVTTLGLCIVILESYLLTKYEPRSRGKGGGFMDNSNVCVRKKVTWNMVNM